ncbi:hypothetical protein GmHk_13G036400 [Glycine max]|nr:hypothetical protein GmHk_13G036400 [Glycine max]
MQQARQKCIMHTQSKERRRAVSCVLISEGPGEVHEDILERRHLIIPESGIHVIIRKLAVALPLPLALHLARKLRRHHLLRTARLRRVQPRHRVGSLEVQAIRRRILRLHVFHFVTFNFVDPTRWWRCWLLLLNCTFLVVNSTQHPVIQLHNQKQQSCANIFLIFNFSYP